MSGFTTMQDFDDFTLAHQLSATASADPNDVLNTKSAFRRLGYYDVPPYGLTPYPDQQLFDGIRNYQRDKRLTVDGIMLPQGETERSISKDLVTTRAVAENDDESGCAQNALAFLPDFPGAGGEITVRFPGKDPRNSTVTGR